MPPRPSKNAPDAWTQRPWDTRLDASVGEVDQQISDLERYRGTALFTDAKMADLQRERAKRNVARWQTARLSGTQARDWLQGKLNTGELTWDDLGGIDISALRDEGQLAQAVDGLLKAKITPPPPPPAETGPDPVATASQQAQEAVTGELTAVQDYAKSALDPNNPDSALGKFDAALGDKFRAISSTAARQAHNVGAEDAGFMANQSAAGLQASGGAARAIEQKDALADVQNFINAHVGDNLSQQFQFANLKADELQKVQTQGIIGLRDEIAKAVNMADTKAVAQLNELNAAINNWQTQTAQGQENTRELHRILGLAAGIILTGAGAAAAVVPGGQGVAPFLVAGGVSTIGHNI